jgi:hypothetical protein
MSPPSSGIFSSEVNREPHRNENDCSCIRQYHIPLRPCDVIVYIAWLRRYYNGTVFLVYPLCAGR